MANLSNSFTVLMMSVPTTHIYLHTVPIDHRYMMLGLDSGLMLSPTNTQISLVSQAGLRRRLLQLWYPHTNLGVVSFDLDADLSSYFKWNTKLLFVSAIVEFSNSQYEVNQAVIWDDVILDRKMLGSSANFTLQFQVVPWVGIMRSHRHVIPDAITFPVPATKKTRS
ncbi:hypothetical protein BSLG_009877 [Batrachochytrium salamandrivorans]|nr:hypothetical protein BSLG_009877 [Batrachochytrium salamandrivorans]